MNIFKHATQACRSISHAACAILRAASRTTVIIAPLLDRALAAAARVLCVESHGVMVCGASTASVAHFTNPHFSSPQQSL